METIDQTTELLDPALLTIHPLLKDMPKLDTESPEFIARVEDIRAMGILEPIKIDDANRIVDGRHRYWIARRLQLTQVPVRRVPLLHVAEVILSSLTQRHHYSKGQLAYMVVITGVLDQAYDESRARQTHKLKHQPTRPDAAGMESPGRSVSDWAEVLGISHELVRQAREVKGYFGDTTKRVLTDDEGCTESGVTFREFFEPRMFRAAKPYGMGAVLKGIGFLLAAEKHPHKATGGVPKDVTKQLRLFNEVTDHQLKRWTYWQGWDEEARRAHLQHVRTQVAKLPVEQCSELAEYHRKLAAEFARAAKHQD
jgi:hypothetical protein